MVAKIAVGLAVLFFVVASAVGKQNNAVKTAGASGEEFTLVGDWRGESICVVRESACRDEDSLYHFSDIPEKAGRYSLRADKIVDGKPITMGTTECSYDPKQHTLQCPISAGTSLSFTLEANVMHGTMTLADKRPWRKITLKKVGT